AAEKAVTVALAQYRGGTVDFNRVALVEQNLVTQQNLLAQARGSIALGLIQVYRALGGGWEIRYTGCEPTGLPPQGAPHAPAEGQPAARPLTGPAPGPQAGTLPPAANIPADSPWVPARNALGQEPHVLNEANQVSDRTPTAAVDGGDQP